MELRTDVEFHAKVLKVEEKFERVYDKSFGDARTESQAGYTEVSTGWWVLLEGWPVSLRYGKLKPDCEPGDTIVMEWRVHKHASR